MINELDLLWLTNFIALGIYFIFGTKFSWNEAIDTCFNVECVLFGHNFDFLGCYCSLPMCYCSLQLVTWWLLLVTGDYCLLLLVPTFSMNTFPEEGEVQSTSLDQVLCKVDNVGYQCITRVHCFLDKQETAQIKEQLLKSIENLVHEKLTH